MLARLFTAVTSLVFYMTVFLVYGGGSSPKLYMTRNLASGELHVHKYTINISLFKFKRQIRKKNETLSNAAYTSCVNVSQKQQLHNRTW